MKLCRQRDKDLPRLNQMVLYLIGLRNYCAQFSWDLPGFLHEFVGEEF